MYACGSSCTGDILYSELLASLFSLSFFVFPRQCNNTHVLDLSLFPNVRRSHNNVISNLYNNGLYSDPVHNVKFVLEVTSIVKYELRMCYSFL